MSVPIKKEAASIGVSTWEAHTNVNVLLVSICNLTGKVVERGFNVSCLYMHVDMILS